MSFRRKARPRWGRRLLRDLVLGGSFVALIHLSAALIPPATTAAATDPLGTDSLAAAVSEPVPLVAFRPIEQAPDIP